jgi:hypothetical protein
MFSISFSDEPADHPYDDETIAAQSGLIVLGNTLHGFCANLGNWEKATYEQHWLRELRSLVEGRQRVALIVDFYDEHTNCEIWAFFRVDERVYVQNRLFFGGLLPLRFPIRQISDFLDERETLSAEGHAISEWTLSIRDIELFLRRAKTPLISHIP